MIRWSIDPIETDFPFKLTYKDPVICLGSCFAENMQIEARKRGLNFLLLPFGTIFHPLSQVNLLNKGLDNAAGTHIFEKKSNYYSWDASTKFSGTSESDFKEKWTLAIQQLNENLKNASALIVSFGTAMQYKHLTGNFNVANCHKIQQSAFSKKLIDVEMMFEEWSKFLHGLFILNPAMQVVFTVSPVRHLKEGVIENNQSKSRLILLTEKLTEHFQKAHYFPAFELVMDELRDYRFYGSDLIHPSTEAIELIWERFQNAAISKDITETILQMLKLRKLSSHQTEDENFNQNTTLKIKEFLAANPEVKW